jgi:hypothetical protein
VTAFYVFALGSIAVSAVLIALAAYAPQTWYGWTAAHRKLLGRWRGEVGLTGGAILVGTAVALGLVLIPH